MNFESVEEFINKYAGDIVGYKKDGIIYPVKVNESHDGNEVRCYQMVGTRFIRRLMIDYRELIPDLPSSGKYVLNGQVFAIHYRYHRQFHNGLNRRICPVLQELTSAHLVQMYNRKWESPVEAISASLKDDITTAFGNYHFEKGHVFYHEQDIGTVTEADGFQPADPALSYHRRKLCL